MTLPVSTYNIEIGPLRKDHFDWLSEKKYAGWVIITDTNTRQNCLPKLEPFLGDQKTVVIEVPPGERHKHLDTCRFIWQEMFKAGVGRRWCCLNLGGGVVGDMGGFAACTFKRGMDFVQVPTTLLSQVDASVGGKLGIDFYDVKNSIGLFADPQAVWVDPAFLATLSERELRSGYAEIIKHALIADGDHWQQLQRIESLAEVDWAEVIGHSVVIKRDIVREDPYELGRRKVLNFGHTIGHAVESYFLFRENRLLHGEAIAAGIIAEAWLSTHLANLTEDDLREITDYCLRLYGHQAVPEAAFDELISLMQQDKKNEDHRINFTVLDALGVSQINATASPELIRQAIDYYNSLALAD